MVYEPRDYRDSMGSQGMVSCVVVEDETDLYVCGDIDLSRAATIATRAARSDLISYIKTDPEFAETMEPYTPRADAPHLVAWMAEAGRAAGVGPMAAVAGAIAEYVGRACLQESAQVIVENGGDVFVATNIKTRLKIYAGESPVSDRVLLIIKPEQMPLGVCTSSGTFGHSLSLGEADAAVAISPDTALADAWATRLGNMVKSPDDLDEAIKTAQNAPGLTGAVIVKDKKVVVFGDVELAPMC